MLVVNKECVKLLLLFYCVVHFVINNISMCLVLSLVRTRRAAVNNKLSVNKPL